MNEKIIRFLDRMERGLTAFVAVIMSALSLIVCWQVFARYVLQKSPYWVEEFSVTAMMWIGLLGAAACVWTGSHMSLEILVKRLPESAKVWTEILIDLTIGLFSWFLCTQGWVLAESTMTSRMATIPLPIGISYIALPVAGGIMIVFAFVRAIKKVTAHYSGRGEKGHV
jgi:TRAP-type C4-dicarboxylate transport system permease small subunit